MSTQTCLPTLCISHFLAAMQIFHPTSLLFLSHFIFALAMASAIVKHVAELTWSVLEVDVCATQLLRNMYPSAATIQEGISYFKFDFPESLLDVLSSDTPPSLAQLISCSLPQDLDLSTRWVVYLQFYVNNGEVQFGIYCGSSCHADGGQKRVDQYKAFADHGSCERVMPSFVKDILKQEGWQYLGYTVLAAASIFGDEIEHAYLTAAILLLEGMFTAKMWAFKHKTAGSLTGSCLWDANELPYFGLCHHSPLLEAHPPRLLNVFDNPDLERETKEDRKEWKSDYMKADHATDQSKEAAVTMEIVWQSGESRPTKRAVAACSTCRSRKRRCYHSEDGGIQKKENKPMTGKPAQSHLPCIDTRESTPHPSRVSEYNPESVLAALSEDTEPVTCTSGQTTQPTRSVITSQIPVPTSSTAYEARRRLTWYKQHKVRATEANISESYQKYLEEEGAFISLPKTTTDCLLPLYISTLNDLIPITDGAAVFRDHSNGQASIYLVRAICLVVCKTKQAAPFLRLTDSGPLLEPLDFASKLLAGLDAAIKADLEPNRIIKIQILALMHLHNDGLAGVDRASSYLSQAICEAWSMCIHLKIPGNPDDEECKYLWWSLRNFDRLGKPIMAAAPFFIDDADIGVERITPKRDDYRSQITTVALNLGDLMTTATRAYKAGSTNSVDSCWEFPLLWDIISGSNFDQFHMSHQGKKDLSRMLLFNLLKDAAYLKIWYHVAAMLSCRYSGPGTLQYIRRLASADRVREIVSHGGCDGLPPLPLVPYAMFMSTTVIYRALHDRVRDINMARQDLDQCCDALDGLSQRWTSVRGVTKLAKRLRRLISDGSLDSLRNAHQSSITTFNDTRGPTSTSAITNDVAIVFNDEAFQRHLTEIWPSFDASYSQIDWALQDYGLDMEFPSPFDDLLS
jgi:hypothetical protein